MRYVPLLFLLFAVGCTRYEFDMVQPRAQHIGEDPVSVEIAPVRYDMHADDGDLVVAMHNLTDQTLTIRPEKSYIIDKTGATRPVRGMAIAPKGYIKLIFPPPKPYVRDDGPTVGVGFGAYDGGGMATGVGVGRSYGGGEVQNLDENVYWDWKGEGPVRFHLVLADSKDTWEHDLVINRVKR